MAEFEIYDFVSLATPDYSYTLTIKAQGTLVEEGAKNQVVFTGDDGSEEIVTLSTVNVFYIDYDWKMLSADNAGTIVDLYYSAAKANGIARSFKWTGYDSHTYVVRFACALSRSRTNLIQGITSIRLKILGKIAD